MEQKLVESLDECQAIRDIPQLIGDTGFVDVDNFPEYALEAGKSMLDEMRRHTFGEALENFRRDQLGIDPSPASWKAGILRSATNPHAPWSTL